MHLRAIKLRGFKSFPDPVEVRLQPGVAVVVGPNGSGKSNIADALIWAAGSLAPSELRAEKPDDVLFAGSANRAAADHCEVELLFDNEDGALAELDFTEVSIVRRLHRGGEGQYLVNGAHVRRTDVVELLSDVGLGQAMGSIVSQGRVEAILASKPEERRMLVEEAAGLGRFKRRRHRAELKLARVATQVERARDVEAEVAKRLRPLALQATAAERAEKLGVEIASLRAGIAAIDLRTLDDQIAGGRERRKGFTEERAQRRGGARGAARRARTGRGCAGRGGGRPRGLGRDAVPAAQRGSERLELRRESAEGLLERLREPPPLLDAGLLEQARLAEARAAALGRAIAEREGLPPAARALAEEGALLALDQVEVEPGYERAVAAAVGAALIAGTPAEGLALLEQRARARPRQPDRPRARRAGSAARGDRGRDVRRVARRARARGHARGSLLRPGPRACSPSPATPPRRCCSSWRPSADDSWRRRLRCAARADAGDAALGRSAAGRPRRRGR